MKMTPKSIKEYFNYSKISGREIQGKIFSPSTDNLLMIDMGLKLKIVPDS
jgi:hypothetical protein